jgi:anthranilate phosphoribosyltransferase
MAFLSYLHRVLNRESLSAPDARAAMAEILSGSATTPQIAAFLAALRVKGETAEELQGLVMAMRDSSVRIEHGITDRPVLDTCGTGGDYQNTFNISTTAALVVAGAGVCVAKHGNRSVSSRCGSADVLAALGVNVDAPKEVVERCIAECGIGFLFAPRLHPAFKAVAGIRRELGIRSIFNLLGPLANPAGARHQVMGVYEPRWVPILGGVLAALGARHAFVVHGEGLDEITVTGMTHIAEVKDGGVERYTVLPGDLGLGQWTKADIAGGDAEHNAIVVRDVLAGQKGARRDAVLANAAAALVAGGAASDLRAGISLAARSIDQGAATAKLEQLRRLSRAEA